MARKNNFYLIYAHRIVVGRNWEEEKKRNLHVRDVNRDKDIRSIFSFYLIVSQLTVSLLWKGIPFMFMLTQFKALKRQYLFNRITSWKFLHYRSIIKIVFLLVNYRDLFSKHYKSISMYPTKCWNICCLVCMNRIIYAAPATAQSIFQDRTMPITNIGIVLGLLK